MQRVPIVVTATAALMFAVAGPVLAASPANDSYAFREVVGALPFAASVDTTEATTDADDSQANLSCGAPATDASVWYEYTATSDGVVIVDTAGSSYSAGVIILTGTPGTFGLDGCGPGAVAFAGVAGTTYSILVFDDQLDGAGTGGALELSVEQAPGPPSLDLTVDSVGSFNARSGAATITGTITCLGGGGEGEGKSFIGVQISQLIGRVRISGEGGTEFACDGTTQHWSVVVESLNGKFAGGKASVNATSFTCGFDCAADEVNTTVTLRR